MRISIRHLSFYAFLACIAAILTGALQADDDGLNWLGNYQEALRQARETKRPIFLEFRCEA